MGAKARPLEFISLAGTPEFVWNGLRGAGKGLFETILIIVWIAGVHTLRL